MSAISWSLDTPAKRWLALLALAFVVSVGVLMHSFFDALSPPEQTVVVQQPAAEVPEPVHVRSEPAWNSPQPVEAVKQSSVADRVSPFDNQKPPPTKRDPVVYQKMVHHQAEYLRTLIANGKLPPGFGNLTKERIDEMEKNGEMIN
jgi:hypothetical protein